MSRIFSPVPPPSSSRASTGSCKHWTSWLVKPLRHLVSSIRRATHLQSDQPGDEDCQIELTGNAFSDRGVSRLQGHGNYIAVTNRRQGGETEINENWKERLHISRSARSRGRRTAEVKRVWLELKKQNIQE